MSTISRCPRCGGNRVEPAFEGDGAYPVPPMCQCGDPAYPETAKMAGLGHLIPRIEWGPLTDDDERDGESDW